MYGPGDLDALSAFVCSRHEADRPIDRACRRCGCLKDVRPQPFYCGTGFVLCGKRWFHTGKPGEHVYRIFIPAVRRRHDLRALSGESLQEFLFKRRHRQDVEKREWAACCMRRRYSEQQRSRPQIWLPGPLICCLRDQGCTVSRGLPDLARPAPISSSCSRSTPFNLNSVMVDAKARKKPRRMRKQAQTSSIRFVSCRYIPLSQPGHRQLRPQEQFGSLNEPRRRHFNGQLGHRETMHTEYGT